MAKQKGILKIEGTLDDITFYKNGDTYLVRNKGGVSKNRIENDPAFKRTRENGTEFGMVAGASKLLRDANAVLVRKAYDGKLNVKLMQVLTKVKGCDVTSPRGQREVYVGLGTAEGRALLKGFDFNSRTKLHSVLAAPFVLDTSTGTVTIDNLIPAEMLDAPANSTHVAMQSAMLNLNFETGEQAIEYSPVVNLPLDLALATQTLTPNGVPGGSGQLFFFLLIEFFQEVNGVQYALNNGNFNALCLLEVV